MERVVSMFDAQILEVREEMFKNRKLARIYLGNAPKLPKRDAIGAQSRGLQAAILADELTEKQQKLEGYAHVEARWGGIHWRTPEIGI